MTEIERLQFQLADTEQLLAVQTESVVAYQARLDETLRELERSRDEALQASKSKSSFLANMSHEIRTPMNGVMGMAALLLETGLNSDQREFAETILRSAESLLVILNDILDFSKIEAGKLEIESHPFDLAKTLEDCMRILSARAHEKRIDLALRIPPDLPERFLGDEGRIRQIVLNLAGNALKFTEKGFVLVCVQQQETGVYLEIRDTGIGIPADRLGKLFQSFVQADASTARVFGGTGLGLAISRRLVELMGGEIGVKSTVGEGSTFWFRIPFPLDATPPDDKLPDLKGLRALIVDDQPVNRRILEEQLRSRGASAQSFESAAAALAWAAGTTDPVHLVITDLVMPEVDGLQFAGKFRDLRGAQTPILLLTSGGAPVSEEMLATAGIRACAAKPVRPARLYGLIESLLSRPQAEQPPEPAAAKPAVAGPCRVLVVDDNPVNRRVAERMLERMGCQVDLAPSGEQALELTAATRYDVIFMDCQMPGMDGFETSRALRARENGARSPIVAMTAMAMNGDRELCIEAGMDDYLTKPLRPAALEQALQRWVPAAPHS